MRVSESRLIGGVFSTMLQIACSASSPPVMKVTLFPPRPALSNVDRAL